ncbi:hypothetical protein P9D81_13530 [Bacillus haynesii]|uniref:hypothetical protein n=2 Tax=Bacillus haynesii TaxID=1925021 RepID=UPI0022808F43|nr:hypothetical protein [Bacillus haynesii]MCY7925531.1 hypothetical protein [Bacillus haynesii]MCY8002671.1 hypothetical protein [Bacillus haynesii]MCY8101919.1 hypothetical protein [Bacillus haynesii]MCY8385541.1 hypothetical protein [Bacillus haynesii]MCY8469976.1 hypothetical protein [Bacillus haynesii]
MGTDEYYKKYLEESLIKLKTRDLIEFIKREFPEEVNYNHEIHQKKVEALKSLSKTDLSAAIARLARIQRKFDHTKLWTIGAVFIGTALVNLQILFKVNLTKISEENYINCLLYGIAALTVCFVFYRAIRKDKKISDTSAYLKDLIEQVKSDK